MRIVLLCVGRLGERPEGLLARDYTRRASAQGRSIALAPVEIVEVEGRKPGPAGEASALLARLSDAQMIACDRSGAGLSSSALAREIGRWRDAGAREIAFVVGGADGLDETVLTRAQCRLSFGPQTWPHALARVMLAEQVYRALSILAGAPYHREES